MANMWAAIIKRYVLVLFLCYWAGDCFAQSQPPIPTPSERSDAKEGQAEKKENQSTANNTKSESLAPYIHQISSEISQWKEQERKRHCEEKSESKFWSNFGTVVIVIFAGVSGCAAVAQACIYRKQSRLMRLTLEQTKRAANAAKDSVNVSMVTAKKQLRAYVSFSPNLNADNGPFAEVPYQLIFNCTNHGPTEAIGIGFRGKIWRLQHPFNSAQVPKIPEGFDEQRTNLFPRETMKDRNLGFKANTGEIFSAEQIYEVTHGPFAFVVGLKIIYTDTFGDLHETQEFWRIWYLKGERQIGLIPGLSLIS